MRTSVVILGLVLILVANVIMLYFAPYGVSPLEGFQNNTAAVNSLGMANGPSSNGNVAVPNANAAAANAPMPVPANNGAANAVNAAVPNGNMATQMSTVEGFQGGYSLDSAGGAKDQYQAIGAFDGIKLKTGNSVSGWRYTAPNEPLTGAEFAPGPDSLFLFKNNQCKPECCGASFSCGGGCVCTTPQQRQYIAERGGNRTQPEDSA